MMFKRISYFILTNILVLLTISIVYQFVGGYVTADQEILFGPLLIISAVIGFSGALISLAMSRIVAKRIMGVQVIDPNNPRHPYEELVVEKVHRLARAAGLVHMPEVGIYHSRSEEHTSELQSRG